MSNEYQNIVNFVGWYRDPDVLHLLPPSLLKFSADTRNRTLEEWANRRETMSLTRAESGGKNLGGRNDSAPEYIRHTAELRLISKDLNLKWRLRWFGHVQRMEENRISKRVLYMNLETTRPRGRPRNRWLDEVRQDGRMVGGEKWQEKVYDREEWKRLLRTARNHRILYMPMD